MLKLLNILVEHCFLSPCLKDFPHIVNGQVRALFDDGGKQVDAAGPSIPVQVGIIAFCLIHLLCLDILHTLGL